MNITSVKFDAKGLVPAIIQDAGNGQVLMMAYMNEESLNKTLETGFTWFFSRSRQRLWQKGETSGHVQRVREIYYDCDGDTLLIKVEQTGAACHEGTRSCFTRRLDEGAASAPEQGGNEQVLEELYQVINDRKNNPIENSYTCYLFEKGQDKILKKVGEEAAETIIASKNSDNSEVLSEMADLWYHCLVLLALHNAKPAELLEELGKRRGIVRSRENRPR